MRGGWVSYLRPFLLWRGLDSLYKAVRVTESLRGDKTHDSGTYLGTDVRGTRGHLLVFVEVYSERCCHLWGLYGWGRRDRKSVFRHRARRTLQVYVGGPRRQGEESYFLHRAQELMTSMDEMRNTTIQDSLERIIFPSSTFFIFCYSPGKVCYHWTTSPLVK